MHSFIQTKVNSGEFSSRYNLWSCVCIIGYRILPNSSRLITLHESASCCHGSRSFVRTKLSSLQRTPSTLSRTLFLLWLKVTILYFKLKPVFNNFSLSLCLLPSLWLCSRKYVEKSRLSWVISKQPFVRLSSQYSTRKGSENLFQLLQFGIQLQLHVSIKLGSVAILGLIRGGKCAEQASVGVKECPLNKQLCERGKKSWKVARLPFI